MTNTYLAIGHSCHDKTPNGYLLGGTVSYASILAKAWNRSPQIITSVGEDFQFFDVFKELEIPIYNKQAKETTIFENIYKEEKRTQYLRARGENINVEDLLEKHKKTSIVHFGPIADELDIELLKAFPQSLKGLSLQGMLRQWDENGLVTPKAIDWSILQFVDVVFLSEEDIKGEEAYLEKIKAYCPQVVLTHGARGATVYQGGETSFYSSYPVKEIDPTGAGDTFTTAYLLDYAKSKDIRSACIFAHCAASFIVEGKGLSRIPNLEEVHKRKLSYEKEMNKDF